MNASVVVNKDSHYFALLGPRCGLFFVSGNSADLQWAECYVDESRYKLSENYKVTLRAIDQDRFSYRDYYIEDFESLLQDGYIIEKPSSDVHPVDLKWEEYVGGTKLVHEATVIVQSEVAE